MCGYRLRIRRQECSRLCRDILSLSLKSDRGSYGRNLKVLFPIENPFENPWRVRFPDPLPNIADEGKNAPEIHDGDFQVIS